MEKHGTGENPANKLLSVMRLTGQIFRLQRQCPNPPVRRPLALAAAGLMFATTLAAQNAAPKPPQPAPAPANKAQPAKAKAATPAPLPAHFGRARVLHAKLPGLPEVIGGDAGGLTTTISVNHASEDHAAITNILTARMLHAAIIGQAGQSHAEASLANLQLTVGQHRISASFIAGRARAACARNGAAASGRSEIIGLVVDGRPVPAPAQPNQRVWWPDGYLALDEQGAPPDGPVGSHAVTPLRVVLKDGTDITIAAVAAGLDCAQTQPCGQDIITGSGWITMRANPRPLLFAATMWRTTAGGLAGHLVFEDAAGGIRFTADGATTYRVSPSNPNSRLIAGTGMHNGREGVNYRLELTDGGETGDQFLLVLGNAYTVSGTVQGGRLRLLPCR